MKRSGYSVFSPAKAISNAIVTSEPLDDRLLLASQIPTQSGNHFFQAPTSPGNKPRLGSFSRPEGDLVMWIAEVNLAGSFPTPLSVGRISCRAPDRSADLAAPAARRSEWLGCACPAPMRRGPSNLPRRSHPGTAARPDVARIRTAISLGYDGSPDPSEDWA
jgi:hypothetical protein